MLFAALTLLAAAAAAPGADRPVQVEVARDGENWTATYVFRERAKAWVFVRSNPDLDGVPWRQEGWTVETPGVTLIRAGENDALVADGAMPKRVRIRFTPLARSLRADYTPALAFSDGGIALYTDHFLVAPRPSIAAVAAFDAEAGGAERPNVVTVRDPGRRLVVRGKVTEGSARREADDPDLYVYSGTAPIVETPTLAGIFDPGLPAWLRGEFDTLVPRLFDLYTTRLGTPAGSRPTALVAWQGAERDGWSMNGSVLAGTVVIAMSGKRVLTPGPPVTDRVRWFFGHESAHFWLGQTINYQQRRDAWITEGSADIMAVRALGALTAGYDMREELQRELDECLKVNGTQPLATASARGEVRANYTCGAMLALAAEAAERRQTPAADVFTWLRRLIDAHRADGKITTAKWTAAFEQAVGRPEPAAAVTRFVEQGVADPAAFFGELFTATGVAHHRDGARLVLD